MTVRSILAGAGALALVALLATCHGSGGDPVPHGLAQREDPDLSQIPVSGAVGPVQLVALWPGFSFSSPVGVFAAPGQPDRLFVMEQAGVVWSVTTTGSPARARFLDLSALVQSGGEEGLLGLAFAPDFAQSGHLYVDYSRGGPRRSVLSRLTANGARTLVDPATELVLLEVAQPYANHNGGALVFGTDGMLYWSLGDGGSGGDPQGNGQRMDTHLGKVLRLDVSQARPGALYQVPSDNPFVGISGARPEIWALGLRNPWRMSVDRTTGELWVGDVGQGAREEIDVIVRGGNYGWNFREGTEPFRSGAPAGLVEPVFDYPRSEGFCVTGGHVYRGSALSGLVGMYVYGDYGSGRIWALRRRSGGAVDHQLLLDSRKSISSFGEDADGEVLVCSHGEGQVFRIAPGGGGGSAPVMPATLSATRLFADVRAHRPARGVVPYDVNAALWSDGAEKERFLALPAGTHMAWRATEAWQIPAGAVLVKTFSLLERDGDPATRRRVETRVLVHGVDRVDGYSFQWRDDQGEADLLAGGTRGDYVLRDAGGNARTHTHVFPSRAECQSCHTTAAGWVLGIQTAQLNRDLSYPSGVRDHQIRALSHVGLLNGAPAELTGLPRLWALGEDAASVESRARSWLDVNCSHCHRPGAVGNATIDLRASTALAVTGLPDQPPLLGDLGVPGARLILPGDATRSVLWLRATRRDGFGMPPLASLRVDPPGSDLLRQWIEQLPR